MLLLKTPSVLPGFKLSLGLTVLCLSLWWFAVCDDGGQSGGNRLERILEHDYRTQCLGSRLAELADVVLCNVDQYRFRYVGCLGIGALRISRQRVSKRFGRFAVCATDSSNRHCVGNPVCAQWLDRPFFRAFGHQNRLYAYWHLDCADCRQPALIVRAVQPVLEELSGEYEEAAATLGASRWNYVPPRSLA